MPRFLLMVISLLALSCASTDIPPDPVYRETEVRQQRTRVDGEIFDVQESNARLRPSFTEADREAELVVRNMPRDEKFIINFWKEKQKVLRGRYSIGWKTPAELNPTISYGNYGQPLVTAKERASLVDAVQQHLVSANELILTAWRTYQGAVYIATRDTNTSEARHYEFSGHDQTWTFVNVSVVDD
jgi:hypothetical protein